MAGLVAQIEEVEGSGTWVDMAVRKTNTTGSAVSTATPNDRGELIAGVYDLTFANVVPGVSADVTVVASSANNPYNRTTVGVALDGSTVYSDLVGGADLVFSGSGSFSNTWASQIRCGLDFGVFNAFPPDAGTPSDSRQIQIENDGAANAEGCVARLLTMAKRFRKNVSEVVFALVKPFAENATEKLDGDKVIPYEASVENVSGSGSGKTMDLKFDGATVTVKNLTTQATAASTGLNVVDRYRVTTGDLQDLVFKLSQDASEDDVENVLIFEPRFTEIAEDVGGGPGTFGTSDVTLTESGQSSGVITAGGFGYVHVRVTVPDGGNSSSNPYPCDVALQGAVTGAAGWAD